MKAILFDADGVVINGRWFTEHYSKDFGISEKIMKRFFQGVFQDCLVGKRDTREELELVMKDWSWNGTVDELLNYWHRAEDVLNTEILKKIRKLRKEGVKCYLATNNDSYRTEYMTKQMGFDKLFDGIFSSSDLGITKSSQEFFRIVEERIQIQKKDILLIDDSMVHIETAKEFGLETFFYSEEKLDSAINEFLHKNSSSKK